MSCVVYCLVPDPEQLDPLIERIKDAGVSTRDIAVVPRRHWPQPAPGSPRPAPSTLADSPSFAPCFWGLSFASAALWWQWALNSAGERAGKRGHAVIPLELYENRRAGLKGR